MKIFLTRSYADEEFATLLIRRLKRDGHVVTDPFFRGITAVPVASFISNEIRRSDLVVSVRPTRPNHFYELGLSEGAGVAILIAADQDVLPFDVAGMPYVQLTGDSQRDAEAIARRIEEMKVAPNVRRAEPAASAEEALRSALADPSTVDNWTGQELESQLVRLFRERRYGQAETATWAAGRADLVLPETKRHGPVFIEIRKLSSQRRVAIADVEQLIQYVASNGPDARGLLITTSSYTTAAVALAQASPVVLKTLRDVVRSESLEELLLPKQTPDPTAQEALAHVVGRIGHEVATPAAVLSQSALRGLQIALDVVGQRDAAARLEILDRIARVKEEAQAVEVALDYALMATRQSNQIGRAHV